MYPYLYLSRWRKLALAGIGYFSPFVEFLGSLFPSPTPDLSFQIFESMPGHY